MQDAKRLQEQFDEMVFKAEAQAQVAARHHEIVTAQRHQASRDLAKFKLLNEVFTMGTTLLNQKKASFQKEEGVETHLLEGLDAAVEELGRISRQALDAMMRFDGSQAALQALEGQFKEEQVQATSRARGLAVQGQRAVRVASGTIEDPNDGDKEVMSGPEEESAPLNSTQEFSNIEDSAKEPIVSP